MKYTFITIIVLAVLGLAYWTLVSKSEITEEKSAPAQADLYDNSVVVQPIAEAPTTTPAVTTSTQINKPVTNQNYMMAILHTSKGDITIDFNEATPNTVANFVKLAKSGYYDGTKFHRVIKGFMNQGGDPLSKDDSKQAMWGTGGPGYEFDDEITSTNSNVAGTISMANAGPNTNGSQFFLNVGDNSFLDPKHTSFGTITAGMNVVKAINDVATDRSDRPLEPVVIKNITLK